MTTRVALISIIVSEMTHVEELNRILSENNKYIIGRMGIPYREKNVNLISVVVDAPQDKINTMTGKIGKLQGITSKTLFSPIIGEEQEG